MTRDFSGLKKLAQITTVGDVMARINADMTLSAFEKERLIKAVANTGVSVNQPGSRLLTVLSTGVLGNAISHYLHMNPFWSGVTTIGSMLYGNHLYNRNS